MKAGKLIGVLKKVSPDAASKRRESYRQRDKNEV